MPGHSVCGHTSDVQGQDEEEENNLDDNYANTYESDSSLDQNEAVNNVINENHETELVGHNDEAKNIL